MKIKSLSVSVLFFSVLALASVSQATSWKGLFVAGDHSIENFDNGREDLTNLFTKLGDLESIQLSSSKKYISVQKDVYSATYENIVKSFDLMKSKLKATDGCFIHMTSHGAKGQGFYLALSGILDPDTFSTLVNQVCGSAPTVVLISACYSGQFITEDLKGPNRVILTAARADRPSFGCSPDTEYTYWDGCLLEEVPKSQTWVELYKNVNSCIAAKEAKLNVRPSEPQAFFGENTKNWEILK